MTVREYALRILYALQDIIPGTVTVVLVTLLAVVGLYFTGKSAWLGKKRFLVLSLFFGLDGRIRLRLACCWIKLVLTCFFLAAFQPMAALHYWMLLLPGILGAFLDQGLRKWAENLFWLGLQILGLMAANLICRFIIEMAGGMIFVLIYVGMALFLGLLAVYLFLNEVSSVSFQRSIEAEDVWGEDALES